MEVRFTGENWVIHFDSELDWGKISSSNQTDLHTDALLLEPTSAGTWPRGSRALLLPKADAFPPSVIQASTGPSTFPKAGRPREHVTCASFQAKVKHSGGSGPDGLGLSSSSATY